MLDAPRGVVVATEERTQRRQQPQETGSSASSGLQLQHQVGPPARLKKRVRRGWTREGRGSRSPSQRDTDLDHSAQFRDLCML